MSRATKRFHHRIGLGMFPLIAIAALASFAVALTACGSSGESSATAAGSSAGVEEVKINIKSDEEHGKKGSDGQYHDAFLPADFSVKAGATVRVTVYNYDDMPHSFNAAGLKVDQVIAAGAEGKPSKTTFTFTAPAKAGSYEWICAIPCDEWAMKHDGFMKGHVTVV